MIDHLRRSQPDERGASCLGASLLGDVAPEPERDRSLRLLSALPVVSVSVVLGSAWAAQALAGVPAAVAVAVATIGCGVVLVLGDRKAVTATNAATDTVREAVAGALRDQMTTEYAKVAEWLARFESLIGQGRGHIAMIVAQIERGEAPLPPAPAPRPGRQPTDNPYDRVTDALRLAQGEAVQAVATGARRLSATEMAEVYLYVARRLMVLNSRALEALTALESRTEDPELLDDLYRIDHLVTLTRRAGESLAVLGGATARRVSQALPVSTVLRQAGAEVEQFQRVRVVSPRTEVWIPGHAGPDVIHLLAELIENATKFSPRTQQVIVRASSVPAGLAIEVEDRGLPMSPEKLAAMNALLASPADVDPQECIRNLGLGLVVAGLIARRHGIVVQLQTNVVGGTQAVVVLPDALLTVPEQRTRPAPPQHVGAAPGTDTPPPVAAPLPPETPTRPAPPSRTASATAREVGSLPQRRRGAALPPTADTAAARPPLPKRPDGQQPAGPADAASDVDPPIPQPAQPASHNFAASFSSGTRRAADASSAPRPGDG